jgi:hypothetical protein
MTFHVNTLECAGAHFEPSLVWEYLRCGSATAPVIGPLMHRTLRASGALPLCQVTFD